MSHGIEGDSQPVLHFTSEDVRLLDQVKDQCRFHSGLKFSKDGIDVMSIHNKRCKFCLKTKQRADFSRLDDKVKQIEDKFLVILARNDLLKAESLSEVQQLDEEGVLTKKGLRKKQQEDIANLKECIRYWLFHVPSPSPRPSLGGDVIATPPPPVKPVPVTPASAATPIPEPEIVYPVVRYTPPAGTKPLKRQKVTLPDFDLAALLETLKFPARRTVSRDGQLVPLQSDALANLMKGIFPTHKRKTLRAPKPDAQGRIILKDARDESDEQIKMFVLFLFSFFQSQRRNAQRKALSNVTHVSPRRQKPPLLLLPPNGSDLNDWIGKLNKGDLERLIKAMIKMNNPPARPAPSRVKLLKAPEPTLKPLTLTSVSRIPQSMGSVPLHSFRTPFVPALLSNCADVEVPSSPSIGIGLYLDSLNAPPPEKQEKKRDTRKYVDHSMASPIKYGNTNSVTPQGYRDAGTKKVKFLKAVANIKPPKFIVIEDEPAISLVPKDRPEGKRNTKKVQQEPQGEAVVPVKPLRERRVVQLEAAPGGDPRPSGLTIHHYIYFFAAIILGVHVLAEMAQAGCEKTFFHM